MIGIVSGNNSGNCPERIIQRFSKITYLQTPQIFSSLEFTSITPKTFLQDDAILMGFNYKLRSYLLSKY